MIKIWTGVFLALLLFIKPSLSSAQEAVIPKDSVKPIIFDPIAAMLDSLVKLHFLNKYPQAHGTKGTDTAVATEGPVFTDEVYRDRISKIKSPIPLTYNSQVKGYIDLYASRKRGLTQRVMGLSNLYFPLFEEVLDQQGLPLEFKYLSIVESALNPVAVSPMGATGIWQFMYNTGKMYNLKVTSFIDERRDPHKATVAACGYFKDMYRIYGDWLLVIAAYNCGPGNVNKAIARAGGKRNFWDISPYLPSETRGYVPAFIAVCYVMKHAADHNLVAVPPALSYFDVDTVQVTRPVSLNRIASVIDIPIEILSYLNPVYKRNYIHATTEPQVLRLPVNKMAPFIAMAETIYETEPDEAAQLAEMISNTRDEYVTGLGKKTHVVKGGENISSIARKYKVQVNDVKRWNNLRNNTVRAGQKLTVYAPVKQKIESKPPAKQGATEPSVDAVANSTQPPVSDSLAAGKSSSSDTTQVKPVQTATKKPSTEFIYHTIQPGDTLWNIARRYDGVTVEKLKEMNKITDASALVPGTRIKVKVKG